MKSIETIVADLNRLLALEPEAAKAIFAVRAPVGEEFLASTLPYIVLGGPGEGAMATPYTLSYLGVLNGMFKVVTPVLAEIGGDE